MTMEKEPTRRSTSPVVSAAARQRERSILVATLLDLSMLGPYILVGLWANSLMMLAEALRGGLLIALEVSLLVLLRRIQRGRIHSFDYGAGKLEQFANLGIGLAMGLGGLWVAGAAAYRWWHPPDQQSIGLAVAAVLATANVVQNGAAFRGMWRAGRDGSSVIMVGQIRARLAKLLCSGVVVVALAINAVFDGGPIGTLAEVLGSAFVALLMLELAISMWRQALPSLLDRTLAEGQQELINRSLVAHFESYDALISVRSRLSGNTPIVEIVLGFEPHRTVGDVQRVVNGVSGEVRELISGAVVVVVPVAWSVTPAPGQP